MLKALALTAALGAMSAMFAVDAGATPLAQAKQTAGTDEVTLVRDGCGPGRHRHRGHCVGDNPIAPIIRDVIRPGRCGPGRHWSNRWHRCVRN
jgi:hypothetical protein